jgi:hypothetical protein
LPPSFRPRPSRAPTARQAHLPHTKGKYQKSNIGIADDSTKKFSWGVFLGDILGRMTSYSLCYFIKKSIVNKLPWRSIIMLFLFYFDKKTSFDVSNSHPKIPVVAIIGVGYIGSAMYESIRYSAQVSLIDISPSIDDLHDVKKLHSNKLSRSTLLSFDVVIFLGGCTGRISCAKLAESELFEENIQSVLKLAMKMSPEQHFIIASTSAVMEGILDARETDEIHFDQLDMYSQSMASRERKLREFCAENIKCPRLSFLRFGTVIGSSKGQRTDLLVPGLFTSAYSE